MRKIVLKIILLLLIIIMIKEIILIFYDKKEKKEEVRKYYNNEIVSADKMIISIPKIDLELMVNKSKEDFSNLNNSLIYYKNNDHNKTIIIMGHSGMGYGTYFNRLDELKLNDVVYLDINHSKIKYKVIDIFIIDEQKVDILNTDTSNTLLLLTCKKNDNTKRYVIKLVKKA